MSLLTALMGEKVVQLGSRAQRGGSESRGAIIFVRGVRCSWKREPTWWNVTFAMTIAAGTTVDLRATVGEWEEFNQPTECAAAASMDILMTIQ